MLCRDLLIINVRRHFFIYSQVCVGMKYLKILLIIRVSHVKVSRCNDFAGCNKRFAYVYISIFISYINFNKKFFQCYIKSFLSKIMKAQIYLFIVVVIMKKIMLLLY